MREYRSRVAPEYRSRVAPEYRSRVDNESRTGAGALGPWPYSDIMQELIGRYPVVIIGSIQEVGANSHSDHRTGMEEHGATQYLNRISALD